jgi:hypothetical protein
MLLIIPDYRSLINLSIPLIINIATKVTTSENKKPSTIRSQEALIFPADSQSKNAKPAIKTSIGNKNAIITFHATEGV